VGLFAYPFFFGFLILAIPRMFGLPANFATSSEVRNHWNSRSTGLQKKAKRICCSIYWGLTVLYFAVIVITLWGVNHLADTRLQQNFVADSMEPWVGNYIVLESMSNGTIGYLYSSTGMKLGDITFMENPESLVLGITGSPENFDTITYTNGTNDMTTLFTATCRGPSGNGTSNPCLSGAMTSQPMPYNPGPGRSSVAEYNNLINVTINQSTFLNVSSNTTVGTSSQYYQGIGLDYPPLGTWFQNSSTLLQVLWSTSSAKACSGLRINLSKENEVLAWPVLGIIWAWWVQWGEGGGCAW
jgi:hypothetical protein